VPTSSFYVSTSKKVNLLQSVASKINSWIDLVTDLQDSSNNAVNVLNELMSYDKIETNTYHIEKEFLPVWKFINDAIKPFHIQAREKGLQMFVSMPTVDDGRDSEMLLALQLVGDSVKLGQVIRNVISNALKFSPSESVIHVSVNFRPNELLDEGV
jgi:signal transduction histidine kinase